MSDHQSHRWDTNMARNSHNARPHARVRSPAALSRWARRSDGLRVTITQLPERDHWLAAVKPNRGHLRERLLTAVKEATRDNLAQITPDGVTFFAHLAKDDLDGLITEMEGWLERA